MVPVFLSRCPDCGDRQPSGMAVQSLTEGGYSLEDHYSTRCASGLAARPAWRIVSTADTSGACARPPSQHWPTGVGCSSSSDRQDLLGRVEGCPACGGRPQGGGKARRRGKAGRGRRQPHRLTPRRLDVARGWFVKPDPNRHGSDHVSRCLGRLAGSALRHTQDLARARAADGRTPLCLCIAPPRAGRLSATDRRTGAASRTPWPCWGTQRCAASIAASSPKSCAALSQREPIRVKAPVPALGQRLKAC